MPRQESHLGTHYPPTHPYCILPRAVGNTKSRITEDDVKYPSLRTLLLNGLWSIEMPAGASRAEHWDKGGSGSPWPGLRPSSAQTVAVWKATGRHLHMTRDPGIETMCQDYLERHLKLDETVPPDLLSQFRAASVAARYVEPMTESNLHSALSHVYALVNRIVVDPTLRKNPHTANLWATWNLEGDTTYLARGIDGAPTSTSGTADGACIAPEGHSLSATAILETKLAHLFFTFQRVAFNHMLSTVGFDVYLSWGANRFRAWNCPLIDGSSTFWSMVLCQMWESMHVYKCDYMLLTSWSFSAVVVRRGRSEITASYPVGIGPPSEPLPQKGMDVKEGIPFVNLFMVLLSAALCNVDDDPDRLWAAYPDVPDTIPRMGSTPLDNPDCLPPTIPTTMYGWGEGSNRGAGSAPGTPTRSLSGSAPSATAAHFIQTYPEDDDTIGQFLELTDASGRHSIRFAPGGVVARGKVYTKFRVDSTSFIPREANVPRGGIIAKIVNLSVLPYTDTKWSLSRTSIQRQVREEAALYCGPLASLQGRVVPRFYGLFEGHYGKDKDRTGIMMMLMEDLGPPIAKTSVGLDRDTSALIIGAYEVLHAAHVVHGDTGVQHVRRAADGSVRLVDFEYAWVVNPARRCERADLLDEQRCMLREFGFEIPEHLRDLVPPWEMSDDEE